MTGQAELPACMTADVVESCRDNLANSLTFALRFKTCEPETTEKLGGDMWIEEFNLKTRGWFKGALAAVTAVLPSSCQQIMMPSKHTMKEGGRPPGCRLSELQRRVCD